MNSIGDVEIISPNNKEETCILFVIDNTTVPFVMNNVTKKDEEYVLSFWAKTDTNASLKISEENMEISSEWKKYKVNFIAAEESIKIFFNNTQTYYLYRPKLEKGNVSTDWSPSPDDVYASLELKVNSDDLISEINASANVIRLKSNRLVVESDNLQIYEDGTLKTQRGEIGGFILHDKILSAEADKHAEINIKYHTYADTEPREGFIKIGNDAENEGGSGEGGIYVQDYDLDGYEVYTRIGNVLGGGILIETEEPNDAIHINQNGIARVDGKAVCINGREYGVNEVLWSGGYYMTAEHTISLLKAISTQPHGIILVFSAYSGGVQNWNFASSFIPKRIVASHGGSGHDVPLFRADMSTACGCKYLYINDTTIIGHANNNKSGTGTNNIKYNNSAYVLRYVLGV